MSQSKKIYFNSPVSNLTATGGGYLTSGMSETDYHTKIASAVNSLKSGAFNDYDDYNKVRNVRYITLSKSEFCEEITSDCSIDMIICNRFGSGREADIIFRHLSRNMIFGLRHNTDLIEASDSGTSFDIELYELTDGIQGADKYKYAINIKVIPHGGGNYGIMFQDFSARSYPTGVVICEY